MNNDVMKMSIEDFKSLPYRDNWDSKEEIFDSLVIVPTDKYHDSGFVCMDFVGCINNKAIKRLSGCSDVLHIDGIGGYGEYKGYIPKAIAPKGWSIDCLPCGLLRVFCHKKIRVDAALSSFEIYGVDNTTQS